jgi:hypothetical protein
VSTFTLKDWLALLPAASLAETWTVFWPCRPLKLPVSTPLLIPNKPPLGLATSWPLASNTFTVLVLACPIVTARVNCVPVATFKLAALVSSVTKGAAVGVIVKSLDDLVMVLLPARSVTLT